MAENSRPPVAIRIVRPYDTEDLLLENELETIGKTSVVLIGAHPRPTGVILRFEVTLASGPTVLRGEGRVLAHKENAFRGQPGLTLRFTRLDPKSKAIVDRATAMREARGPSSPRVEAVPDRGSPSRSAPRAESPIAEALSAATPAPGPTAAVADQEAAVALARAAAREKANATARANAKRTGRGQGLTPPPPPPAREPEEHEPAEHEAHPTEPPERVEQPEAHEPDAAEVAPEPTPVTSIPGTVAEIAQRVAPPVTAPTMITSARPTALSGAQSATLDPPPNREELLARLRDRAGKLPPERVQEILTARAAR